MDKRLVAYLLLSTVGFVFVAWGTLVVDVLLFAIGAYALGLGFGALGTYKQSVEEDDRYKIFHDHIRAHFENEHPDWKVHCKICRKDSDRIYKESQ